VAAAEMAISSPLLEASIDGAHGVLLSIQGGSDLGLFEINEAAQLVANSAAVDANIIFGAVIDDALGDEVRVTVIAAGFDEQRQNRASSAATVSRPSGGVAPVGSGGAPVNTAMDVQAPASPVSPASSSSWGGTADAAPASPSAASPSAANPSAASHSASNSDGPSAAAASNGGSAGATGESVPGFSGRSGDAGLPRPAPDAGTNGTADGAAGAGDAFVSVPDQPAADAAEEPAAEGVSGYVPAPVSFVSPDDQEPGSDGLQDAGLAGFGVSSGSSGWKDSGRDSGAGRRRPVVFEEDDDLDVPDFLK